MEFLTGLWDYILPFLIVLTVLVFVHELGHYLLARRNGVRVEVFSVGFGPELFGWTDKHKTRWKISAVPLGGYIKMFGEADAIGRPDGSSRPLTDEERRVSFHHKKLRQRSAIVLAGPAANFLFAIVVLAVLFATVGQRVVPANVDVVIAGSAAEAGGLKSGDLILRVGDTEIVHFFDVQRIVVASPDVALRMAIRRDGRLVDLTVTPQLVEEVDRFGNTRRLGRLGIRSNSATVVRHDPFTAVWQAGKQTVALTMQTLQALGQIIVGSRSADELGGIFRIAQLSGEMAQTGIITTISFMALLSINLGLINLFPIPMLDGGHLLFYFFEALRGRPLGQRAQEYSFRLGLALVAGIFLFATYQDRRIILRVVEFFSGLVT